jgi:transmembrane sensor
VHSSDTPEPSAGSAAAQWLARRDRGLTAREQDAYLQWLQETPANGAEIKRLEEAWSRLDKLQHWHPAHSSKPNPDLLAPSNRRKWIWPSVFAAAAALTFVAVTWWEPVSQRPDRRGAVIHPGPEQLALDDGSLVELNANAKIEVNFTANRRGVRLVQGEAHFAVAKDPSRPFVVTADTFEVRAVGTAFAVQLNRDAVSVLVTEGNVELDELRNSGGATQAHPLSGVVAGQEAVVTLRAVEDGRQRLRVREMTPADMASALSWQTMRLEFVDLPLRDVVEEFNRFNSRKLLIEDRETGDIIVGGSFRADNVEPFVRLLEVGFGVSSTTRGNAIVLQRRR